MVAAIQVQVRLWQCSASAGAGDAEEISGVVWADRRSVLAGISAGKGRLRLHDTGSISGQSVRGPYGAPVCQDFQAPVSVFLVPGILPLVPGTSIYNSVYYVIRNSREESMYYLVETLQIAGAIALAVFLMDSVFKLIGKKKRIKV